MFAGGAVERMAIFALNVMPYISASIIMTLMKGSIGSLKELDKDGQQGRKQINQYTRYLTVFLAAFQAYGIARALQSTPGAVINPGLFFEASTVITLVGGTMFLMWLFMPLKLNTAGVIPPIFASSLLLLPATFGQLALNGDGAGAGVMTTLLAYIGYGSPVYLTLYAVLIIFFCYFYVPYVFKPDANSIASDCAPI